MLVAVLGENVSYEFIPSGITMRTGGYRPIRAEMDKESSIVKKAPEKLTAPKYGQIEFEGRTWAFLLDDVEGEEAKLYVDSNGDGDLTNDPEAKWKFSTTGGAAYTGEATIELEKDKVGKINLYRFDPNDKARAALKNTVLFYADFGYEYTIPLDGQEFKTSVAGVVTDKSSFWLDRDKNGVSSRRFEMAKVGEPFNFTGTTYELSVKNNLLVLNKSEKSLPQLPMPPDLRIGKKALTFEAKTLTGDTVQFPKSYAGKLVMLDFWATWCGPCIGEIPNMKQAYADWHDKGFEILGVSFDQENMEEKLTAFLEKNELPWPQIYEGKYWDTSIGVQHDVSGIPFVLLVDGDSGEILATARQLRGKGLSEFVGKMLEKKEADKGSR